MVSATAFSSACIMIQADEKAVADTIIKGMDGAKEAGVSAISLASEPK